MFAQNWIGTSGTSTLLHRTGKTGIGMSTAPSCTSTIFEVDSAVNITGQTPAFPALFFNCNRILYAPDNNNLFAGIGAGTNNIPGAGNDNSFFGRSAGNSNINGKRNSYFGKFAAEHNEGSDNVVLGSDALLSATSVNESVYVGSGAGFWASGERNVVIGFEAGHEIKMPTNTLIGYRSGRLADWANENTMVGYETGLGTTTASGNTFLGYLAGRTVIEDNGNTFVGAAAGANYIGSGTDGFNTTLGSSTVVDNFVNRSTAIGHGSRVCDNNTIVLGSGSSGANEVVVIGNCGAVNGGIGDLEIVGPTGSGTRGLWADGIWYGSDINLKKDLRKIDNPIEIIKNLNGYLYSYKDSVETGISKPSELQAGVIAQELLEFFPIGLKKGNSGYYGVDYHHLIPLLIEGIKAQQVEIESLRTQVEANDNFDRLNMAAPRGRLMQNNPNPSIGSTKISYEISSECNHAEIQLFDMSGTLLFSEHLENTDQGDVFVDTTPYKPGIYAYNLMIDGSVVDTKTMIITR